MSYRLDKWLDLNDRWIISWFDDKGEPGSALGEMFGLSERDLEKERDPEKRDSIAAELAASKSPGVQKEKYSPFYWESAKEASVALRMARAAAKAAREGSPWPDWALTAQAHGWKPPPPPKDGTHNGL